MSNALLDQIIIRLGLAPAPRYCLEEVALILGVTREQVRRLIKKKYLKGFKGTASRWTAVFHDDLASFVARGNRGTA